MKCYFLADLQECVNEDQIKRDIHRTFPANDFFKDDQGPGQEALLKLTKVRRCIYKNLIEMVFQFKYWLYHLNNLWTW